MKNNKCITIIALIITIVIIITLSIFIQRKNIISTIQSKKAENLQDIIFETYYNKNNVLKILVTAIDTENGINTLTYEKEDGNKLKLNGNGKNKIAIDYQVENALLQNALNGNITAQIFWLKNRRPTKWKDKRNEEDNNTDNVNNAIQNIANLINNPKKIRTEDDLDE